MIKMKIVMDEQKILSKDEYEVKVIQEQVKKCFDRYNFKMIEENVFCENGKDGDVECLMALIAVFKKCEWFMTYLKEWLWIDGDYVENLLN